MTKSVWMFAASVAMLATPIACDTSTTPAAYLRCWPELTNAPAPATGEAGDQVVLTGRHLLSYLSGTFDPAIDLVVNFGASRAVVVDTNGPYDLVEGACETCVACVAAEDQGCIHCDLECESCLTDVIVIVPEGEGMVGIHLINGMGESNPQPFTYTAAPTASPSPTP